MRPAIPRIRRLPVAAFAVAVVVAVTVPLLCIVLPSAAQALDPASAGEAQRLESAAAAARQKAQSLLQSANSWEHLIKNNRDKAAAATNAKTRAAYEELAKEQEDGVRKMRDEADALTRTADADADRAARIRRGEHVEPAASGTGTATGTAANGANPIGAPRPSATAGAQTRPSQRVQDYLAVAKQDAERVRRFSEAPEAVPDSVSARIDALNAQADRSVNAPYAAMAAADPSWGTSWGAANVNGWGEFHGWSIDEKQKGNAVEGASEVERAALKRMEDALHDATVNRIYSSATLASERTEADQLRSIDELERTLLDVLKHSFSHRLNLLRQALTWDLRLLEAQVKLRTLEGWLRWQGVIDPIDKSLSAARAKADQAGTFTEDEPKLLVAAMAQLGPFCADANKADARYIREIAARLQLLVEGYRGGYERLVQESTQLVTETYADKSGVKAQLGRDAVRWIGDIADDKRFGLTSGDGLRIDGQVWTLASLPDYAHPRLLGASVGEADMATMRDHPECASWDADIPSGLASQFSMVGVEFRRWDQAYLMIDVSPRVAAAEDNHIAQGGRWPQEGP